MNEKQAKTKDKNSKSSSSEPYFYMALVLKGTEEQHLNLLKYVNNSSGAQIIYQRKSLTYLRVAEENQARLKEGTADAVGLEARGD